MSLPWWAPICRAAPNGPPIVVAPSTGKSLGSRDSRSLSVGGRRRARLRPGAGVVLAALGRGLRRRAGRRLGRRGGGGRGRGGRVGAVARGGADRRELDHRAGRQAGRPAGQHHPQPGGAAVDGHRPAAREVVALLAPDGPDPPVVDLQAGDPARAAGGRAAGGGRRPAHLGRRHEAVQQGDVPGHGRGAGAPLAAAPGGGRRRRAAADARRGPADAHRRVGRLVVALAPGRARHGRRRRRARSPRPARGRGPAPARWAPGPRRRPAGGARATRRGHASG